MDDLLQEMIQPAGPTGHDRARRRRLVMSAATVGLAVIGLTSLTTSALFTDNESAVGGGFTTGSVNVTLTPAADFLKIGNMAPGDTEFRSITVNNPGSLGYRYAVTKAWTDSNAGYPLSAVLQIATFVLPTGGTCDAASAVPAAQIRPLGAISADGATLIGDPATGAHAGDRPILAGAGELLCFQITLPISVGNEYQSSTSTVSVQVVAEQTANN
ncbi:TasA family protein [Pengzhenrongella frigida]|nr:TasA family protein [Cellulomonas sp. HLT2-17]